MNYTQRSDNVTDKLLLSADAAKEVIPDMGPLYAVLNDLTMDGCAPEDPARSLIHLLLALYRANGTTRSYLILEAIRMLFPRTKHGAVSLDTYAALIGQGSLRDDAESCLWIMNHNGERCLDIEIPYGDEQGLSVGFHDKVDASAVSVDLRPGVVEILVEPNDPELSVTYTDNRNYIERGKELPSKASSKKKGGDSK
jgi:hypothetical protein